MSTLWGKHLYHLKYSTSLPFHGAQQSCWHIVVHGQKSLVVNVPEHFPCSRHRAEILSLIDDEDIEEFSLAILVQETAGNWTLIFANGPPPALRCSLWAPLIDERDIHVLEWITGEVKLSIWKGRQVVVKVGMSPSIDENFGIASQSEAYRFLQDTDLTPKFLGHLVRDGVVIGFVLEAVEGRSPTPTDEDRKACQAALTKLYATGTLHSDLNGDNIIMTTNGVRFVDLELSAIPSNIPPSVAADDVDLLFDEEITHCYQVAKIKPPMQWKDGGSVDWERERHIDIQAFGQPSIMPPIQKQQARYDNSWKSAPRIPYLSGAYKPWDISEVGMPSSVQGYNHDLLIGLYQMHLSPAYHSLPLLEIAPGELPGYDSQHYFSQRSTIPHVSVSDDSEV